MSSDRETNIFMAKCAEQAERYDEMVDYMKKVAQMGVELTVEERNLLSVAYKNIIGSRRASWRVITAVENQQENNKVRSKLVSNFREEIEKDLSSICMDLIKILDDHLIKACTTDESSVFHYKLKGDYYRYLAEISGGDKKKAAGDSALEAYGNAQKFAEKLPSTHPIRLGLALNFSVFYYEIVNQPEEACRLAKTAFESAIETLDTLTEEEYKDSTLIMQLLKDNLQLWTSEENEDDEDDEDEEDDE